MKTIKGHPARTLQIKYLLAVLVTLVVSDGLISQFLVLNGLAQEGNPLLRPLIGEGHFLFIKVVGALVSAIILWDIYKRRPKLAMIISLFSVAVYTGIVYWNLAVLFITQM